MFTCVMSVAEMLGSVDCVMWVDVYVFVLVTSHDELICNGVCIKDTVG